MVVQTKLLAEVTQTAIRVLCKEIGVVDTMRFVGQFTAGYGNYTEERDALICRFDVGYMIAEIKGKREQTGVEPHRHG